LAMVARAEMDLNRTSTGGLVNPVVHCLPQHLANPL
jgi:hypothetical protein